MRINGIDIMLARTGSSDVGEELAYQVLQNEGMPPVQVSDVAIHVRVLLRDAEKMSHAWDIPCRLVPQEALPDVDVSCSDKRD